ncbi:MULTISPECIES: penicillin-binding transpeptidase domain-containing protein [Streptacidiphilus]|uniref:Penicillin-binding transpeptidase domain-containing protein n=1 Tax=Streptacidiphilus cavernicola TaxID=3342716 RepID=A0ABV6ULT2_9ACTN|nr:penicillin-binding transpeptidase domain-containing protein [Streptacidiphilus jeojiense]
MNRGAKSAVIGTVVVLFAAGGYGAYNVVHAVANVGSGSTPKTASTAMATTAPSEADAVKRAQSFLDSWKSGPDHYTGAASQTTDPGGAQDALQAYATGVKLSAISFSDVAAAAPTAALPATGNSSGDAALETHVTFTVTAQVKGGTWSYPSSLDVVQSAGGLTSVNWAPSVLYPKLKAAESLAAGPVTADAGSVRVLARDGKTVLTGAKYPSLTEIIATIAQHGGGSGSSAAESGSGIEIVDSNNDPVATAKVFTAPKGASITTTIDARLQAAAEAAVRGSVLKGMPAAVDAIDHSNGQIRAIAYAGTGSDGNTAINAALAPGSTMKIVTAAALFDHTSMTPSSKAPCDATATVYSQTFHNDTTSDTDPNASLTKAFAISCNVSFIKAGFNQLVTPSDASALHNEAVQVFGLGSWSIGGGVQTTDPSVPVPPANSPDQGAQFMGQGQITMSPLVIASLAATVAEGRFEQPVILPGQQQSAAPQAMSSRTDGYLKTLMRAAAHDSDGTAYPRMKDFSSTTGAKTGTAETNSTTNGWFTAYNSEIAVASLVQGGTTGVDSAGYVVQAVLTADE